MTPDEAWATLQPCASGSSGASPRDSYRIAVRVLISVGFTQAQISKQSGLSHASVKRYAKTRTRAEMAAAGLYVPSGVVK